MYFLIILFLFSSFKYLDTSGRKELPFEVHVYPEKFKFELKFSWNLQDLPRMPQHLQNGAAQPTFGNMSVVSVSLPVVQYTKETCPVLGYFIRECSAETSHFVEDKDFCNFMNMRPLTHSLSTYLELFRDLNGPLQLNAFVGTFALDMKHVWSVLDDFAKASKWQEMLEFINILPLRLTGSPTFDVIKNGILCLLVEDYARWLEKVPWSYALAITDSEVKARYVLLNLEHWPVDVCLQTLKICLADKHVSSETYQRLAEQLRLLNMYHAVSIKYSKSLFVNLM